MKRNSHLNIFFTLFIFLSKNIESSPLDEYLEKKKIDHTGKIQTITTEMECTNTELKSKTITTYNEHQQKISQIVTKSGESESFRHFMANKDAVYQYDNGLLRMIASHNKNPDKSETRTFTKFLKYDELFRPILVKTFTKTINKKTEEANKKLPETNSQVEETIRNWGKSGIERAIIYKYYDDHYTATHYINGPFGIKKTNIEKQTFDEATNTITVTDKNIENNNTTRTTMHLNQRGKIILSEVEFGKKIERKYNGTRIIESKIYHSLGMLDNEEFIYYKHDDECGNWTEATLKSEYPSNKLVTRNLRKRSTRDMFGNIISNNEIAMPKSKENCTEFKLIRKFKYFKKCS